MITNQLDFSHNNLNTFSGEKEYMKVISELDLSNNLISYICEETLRYLENISLISLKLTNNQLTKLSPVIMSIKPLQIIKLSGNKFTCDCDMTWMIDWFAQGRESHYY